MIDVKKEAAVYTIEINADIKTATVIGKRIRTEIFRCNEMTKFELVP